jgi:hypothetical protein
VLRSLRAKSLRPVPVGTRTAFGAHWHDVCYSTPRAKLPLNTKRHGTCFFAFFAQRAEAWPQLWQNVKRFGQHVRARFWCALSAMFAPVAATFRSLNSIALSHAGADTTVWAPTAELHSIARNFAPEICSFCARFATPRRLTSVFPYHVSARWSLKTAAAAYMVSPGEQHLELASHTLRANPRCLSVALRDSWHREPVPVPIYGVRPGQWSRTERQTSTLRLAGRAEQRNKPDRKHRQ